MQVSCEVSIGELVDKYTILKIKEKFIKDEGKLKHVRNEKNLIFEVLSSLKISDSDDCVKELSVINEKLWKIEDDIREKETRKEFDDIFINLARLVYQTNDLRFGLKSKINIKYGSKIQEVKSYKKG